MRFGVVHWSSDTLMEITKINLKKISSVQAAL